jgi:hypothetical protein
VHRALHPADRVHHVAVPGPAMVRVVRPALAVADRAAVHPTAAHSSSLSARRLSSALAKARSFRSTSATPARSGARKTSRISRRWLRKIHQPV